MMPLNLRSFNKVARVRRCGNAISRHQLRFQDTRTHPVAIPALPGATWNFMLVWRRVSLYGLRVCDLDNGRGLGGAIGAAEIPALGSATAAEGVGTGGSGFGASDGERRQDCTNDGYVSGLTTHMVSGNGMSREIKGKAERAKCPFAPIACAFVQGASGVSKSHVVS
jgi:hypothetical protein